MTDTQQKLKTVGHIDFKHRLFFVLVPLLDCCTQKKVK